MSEQPNDAAIPMPDGVITCGGKPTSGDIAEMWRFQEFLADVEGRGYEIVVRDPKWSEYLGVP
jgi:hypothetical protein